MSIVIIYYCLILVTFSQYKSLKSTFSFCYYYAERTHLTDLFLTMTPEQEPTDLDWVKLRKDMGKSHHVETLREKFSRKFEENPFVPIGCLATAGALSYGLWAFRQGRSKMSQTMMRLRIVAQGFTIAALIGGVLMAAKK